MKKNEQEKKELIGKDVAANEDLDENCETKVDAFVRIEAVESNSFSPSSKASVPDNRRRSLDVNLYSAISNKDSPKVCPARGARRVRINTCS